VLEVSREFMFLETDGRRGWSEGFWPDAAFGMRADVDWLSADLFSGRAGPTLASETDTFRVRSLMEFFKAELDHTTPESDSSDESPEFSASAGVGFGVGSIFGDAGLLDLRIPLSGGFN